MYAVVSFKGHQYIVKQGDEIIVDNVSRSDDFDITDVLCVFSEDGKDVSLGEPFLSWAKISCSVVESFKGKKIQVIKFKRKNRYSRNKWFRPSQSKILINAIVV